MSKKDKELLLKDLCARLPYGTKIDITFSKEHGSSFRENICTEGTFTINTDLIGLFQEEEIYIKPYLRSISSMTEEEKEEESDLWNEHDTNLIRGMLGFYCSHHLDWNNLIPIGLALKAPEGMYKDN